MKTTILILIILAFLFTGCGARRSVEQDPVATFDEGVVINGVRWATRNVGGHGRFTKNPHDAGGFFSFHNARNACPPGWRLPTREEFQSLIVAESEWMRVNRVRGRSFGTAPNQLFLPAAGYRNNRTDGIIFEGIGGSYWIGASSSMEGGLSLNIGIRGTSVCGGDLLNGLSVRCVADIE